MMNLEKVNQWISWDPNPKDRQTLTDLLTSDPDGRLPALFSKRIAFGTAGLRARMQPGPASMNDLVVIQATQGLAEYLLKTIPTGDTPPSVVIGYDGRHHSLSFAEYAASVLIAKKFTVYLFNTTVPTPLVPFTVVQKKCVAGIMVTASHNPKDDNGYKVYWSTGAQIIPPHDSGIAKEILENLCPLESLEAVRSTIRATTVDPTDEMTALYTSMAKKTLSFLSKEEKATQVIRVTNQQIPA